MLFYESGVFVSFWKYAWTMKAKKDSDLNLYELAYVALLFFTNILAKLQKQYNYYNFAIF